MLDMDSTEWRGEEKKWRVRKGGVRARDGRTIVKLRGEHW